MSAQRQRRWADVVQLLYICFVFTRIAASSSYATRSGEEFKKTINPTGNCK